MILFGCGNSNINTTTKVTNLFRVVTGDSRIFIQNENYRYIKIIDTNVTYQTYIREINQSIEADGDRQNLTPLLLQNINFTKDKIFLYGFSGYAGNGFDESIHELSESVVQINLKTQPLNGLQPNSWFFTVHGYKVNRQIKTIQFGETLKIDLNNTIYY